MKRTQVKLHDNIVRILQEREVEKKERQMHFEMIKELRDQIKLMVKKKKHIKIKIIHYLYPEFRISTRTSTTSPSTICFQLTSRKSFLTTPMDCTKPDATVFMNIYSWWKPKRTRSLVLH